MKKFTIFNQYNPPSSHPYEQNTPNLMKSDGHKEANISYILERFTQTGELPQMSNAQYLDMPNDINQILTSYKQLEHDQALKGATIDDLFKGHGETPLQADKAVTPPSGASAPLSPNDSTDPNGSESEDEPSSKQKLMKNKRSGTASINTPT